MTWLEQKEVINWKFITIEKKYVYPIQIKSCTIVGVFRCFILDLFRSSEDPGIPERAEIEIEKTSSQLPVREAENGFIFKCEFEEIWSKTTNHTCEPFALTFRRSQSAYRCDLPTQT